jgi:hypothetical protein
MKVTIYLGHFPATSSFTKPAFGYPARSRCLLSGSPVFPQTVRGLASSGAPCLGCPVPGLLSFPPSAPRVPLGTLTSTHHDGQRSRLSVNTLYSRAWLASRAGAGGPLHWGSLRYVIMGDRVKYGSLEEVRSSLCAASDDMPAERLMVVSTMEPCLGSSWGGLRVIVMVRVDNMQPCRGRMYPST